MDKLIGKAIPRVEDRRLLTGKGLYTDDVQTPDACHVYFIRSRFAHARIRQIDVATAAAMPGVLAVLTGADYRADGHKFIPHLVNSPDAVDVTRLSFVPTPESPIFEQGQPVLAEDCARFLGEILVAVVAETYYQAQDAAECVEIDCEELTPVVTVADALADNAPQVWPAAPRNSCFRQGFGDEQAMQRAFDAAAYVVDHSFKYQRIVACQMEPRSAIGDYDADSGTYSLISGSQGAVRYRLCLSGALGVPKDKVRVMTYDVGGGFGARSSLNPEAVLVCWAARRVGRQVRWRGDRGEAFLSDCQGRDLTVDAALALDRDGKILAIKADYFGNVGAHTVSFVPLANGFRLISTVYDVPTAWVQIQAVLTHTPPVAPYRGAGRPETTLIMERLLDIAAQRHGFDRVALRQRNLVKKSQLPYVNIMGLTYDSGNFAANMAQALALADWKGFPARRAASRAAGLLRGLGLANYVEAPVGTLVERIEVVMSPDGNVEIMSGTQSTGQGHETVFAQVVGDRLGIPMERIRLVTGDTGKIEIGGGTHSDRSMRLGGQLLVEACGKIVDEARPMAAGLLACAVEDLRFEDGLFSSPTSNNAVSLAQIAEAVQAPLRAVAQLGKRVPAHPTGCAVCELEVDPETGVVQVMNYAAIDDVGQPINPLIVHGQVYGEIAMGIGEALYKSYITDAVSGQVASASFMDYAVSRAATMPKLQIALVEDPTLGNPLRVKGGGECGITPAPAAVINAVVNALAEYGIEHVDMPATPDRVWREIQAARTSA